MRRKHLTFSWCVIFVFILVAFLVETCGSVDWKEADQIARDLTVILFIYQDTTYLGVGNAVVIDKNVIVTSEHLILEKSNRYIIFYNGNTYRADFLSKTDLGDGVAFLRVNSFWGNPPKIGEPDLTEEVMLKGTPAHSKLTNITHYGRVTMKLRHPGMGELSWYADLPALRGNSGCGIWNIKGELIGIVYAFNPVQDRTYISKKFPRPTVYENRQAIFVSAKHVIKAYRDYLEREAFNQKFYNEIKNPPGKFKNRPKTIDQILEDMIGGQR